MKGEGASDVDLLVRRLQVVVTEIRAQQHALEAQIAEAVSLAGKIAELRESQHVAQQVDDERPTRKPTSQ